MKGNLFLEVSGFEFRSFSCINSEYILISSLFMFLSEEEVIKRGTKESGTCYSLQDNRYVKVKSFKNLRFSEEDSSEEGVIK